ncbi:MotA/TolQ/ExbB proton channel family protein [Leptospira borgpetersenii]|uniref:Transporter, MotA/TolQ/ExbB proton channel family protein n=1 Tax=Leptospira borgpetersenii serovar Pomona str. 200901868 TaxID=1192866 RepID=M6W406_LEPBO|nr:MotA/TolQ/ExbB proton channel family protein [Leptospira borgpetersenii]EMO64457.1 transporter, MotA/TolQ/ExbB proton channel family protein [Leptospira borgpetersenii serovar Pomona str. 200901868]MBE8364811.1 MotA/TolQ/ExbB proton channel family protein [Leptospira borgpetersenii serovar Balcanica]MBE8366634.1 MotA/TolQ/ExbB proton channel family protein [Leptospira borgpetersenii serovar Balcanica]MBE8399105.1 MotA/TolQ/ExbB proton channel family protein [Leptospira borgpetersenii serovar
MFLAKSDSLISAIPPESVPIVIVLVSIIGFTIIIERLIYFSKWKPITLDDWRSLKELFRQKNWNTAIDYLKSMNNGPSVLVLQAGIESSLKNLEAAEEEMLSAGFAQILKMERFLSGLGTIATISPLLGVLGTVLGIIRSFEEGSGTRGAEVGISEALITTAMGLAIAIPAYVAYNYFQKKKEDTIAEMENLSGQALKYLK